EAIVVAGEIVAELALDHLLEVGVAVNDLRLVVDRADDVVAVGPENAGMAATAGNGLALLRRQAHRVEAGVIEHAAGADDEHAALEGVIARADVDAVKLTRIDERGP